MVWILVRVIILSLYIVCYVFFLKLLIMLNDYVAVNWQYEQQQAALRLFLPSGLAVMTYQVGVSVVALSYSWKFAEVYSAAQVEVSRQEGKEPKHVIFVVVLQ